MKKKPIIHILGGGPAGISVAYFATENNMNFQLFEATNELGGNCKTFNIDDFYFDSGAHRFHDKDKDSTNLIKSLLGEDLKLIHVPSQIFIENKFVDFPLSPISLIKFLGIKSVYIETLKLIKSKFKKKEITNFRDYTINKYGEKIATKFLLDYSQKLWGLPCEKLSIKVAGNRLKGLNFKSFFFELFGFYNKNVKHLDGSFYYPKNGIWSIFEKLTEIAGKDDFHLNNIVTEIFHKDNKITSVKINNDKIVETNFVVSSLPIDKFINGLNPSPPKEIIELTRYIKYRDLFLIIFLLDKESVNKNGSMYFPSDDYRFTRIYEPRNRSKFMSPINKTSLIVEIPTQNNLEIKEERKLSLINEVKNQLIEIGFFNEKEIIKIETKNIKNAYPILDSMFEETLKPIQQYLNQFENLILNGRNGKFQYNHIHDHIKDGREIISKILQN